MNNIKTIGTEKNGGFESSCPGLGLLAEYSLDDAEYAEYAELKEMNTAEFNQAKRYENVQNERPFNEGVRV